MYTRIAVLYDEPPESARALVSALAIARMFTAALDVIVLMAKHPAYTAYAQALIPGAAEILADGRLEDFDEVRKDVVSW